MPIPDDRVGDKWEAGYQQSIPDAKDNFGDSVTTAGTELKSKLADMKTAYAAVTAADFNAAVDAAFTKENMGRAYNERLDQIAVTGMTASAKERVVENAKKARHIRTQIANIITAIPAHSGMAFVADLDDNLKRSVANAAAMRALDSITVQSTGPQIATAIYATYPTNGKYFGIIVTGK